MTPVAASTFAKYLTTGAVGFLLGMGVVAAMALPVQKQELAAITELSGKIQDIYSAGTVLYEDSPPCGPGNGIKIPILNGGATLTIGSDDPKTASHIARWYIPMKVTAQPLNSANGASSFDHINLKTGALEHFQATNDPHAVLPQ
jgi:hypothetical protein